MSELKEKLFERQRDGTLNFVVPGYSRVLRLDQKVGAAFLCLQKRAILGSPVGVGKTIEGTAAIKKLVSLDKVTTFLVVCETSVIHQWWEELNDYASLGAELLTLPKGLRQARILAGSGRYIATYVSVNTDIQAHLVKGYDCLLLDESVVVKNYRTTTWRSISKLSKRAKFVFFLSGQPYENNLVEIYSQVEACAPGTIGPPGYFNSTFCVWDKIKIRRGSTIVEIPKIVSFKEVDLFKKLVDPILMYRTHDQVGVDKIPIKMLSLKVDLTTEQRLIYQKLEALAEKHPVRTVGDVYKSQRELLQCADTARFFGGTSSSKVDEVLRILQHPVIKGRRVLIYTHFYEMLEHLKEAITSSGFDVGEISGRVKREEREALKQRLKEGTIDVVIITDAAAKGVRLEGASVIILVERPWSGKRVEQIIGRIARQGQTASYVVVILIIAKDTKEDYVSTVISRKERGANAFYELDTILTGEKLKSLDELVIIDGTKTKLVPVWK